MTPECGSRIHPIVFCRLIPCASSQLTVVMIALRFKLGIHLRVFPRNLSSLTEIRRLTKLWDSCMTLAPCNATCRSALAPFRKFLPYQQVTTIISTPSVPPKDARQNLCLLDSGLLMFGQYTNRGGGTMRQRNFVSSISEPAAGSGLGISTTTKLDSSNNQVVAFRIRSRQVLCWILWSLEGTEVLCCSSVFLASPDVVPFSLPPFPSTLTFSLFSLSPSAAMTITSKRPSLTGTNSRPMTISWFGAFPVRWRTSNAVVLDPLSDWISWHDVSMMGVHLGFSCVRSSWLECVAPVWPNCSSKIAFPILQYVRSSG